MLKQDFQQIKKRVENLRKEIDYHRYLYHVLDKQEIDESVLDSLKSELAKLENKYPELITLDSPTQRIGGARLEKFIKVIHKVQQWSFNDAFNKEEMCDFDERVKKQLLKSNIEYNNIEYVAELKIDGCHIVLTYKNGLLVLAATRGDGVIGEDVTQNIRTIESIPLKLNQDIDIVVEGEVWMSKKVLNKLNKDRKKKNEPLLANIRNAAAGALRQLDSKVTRERQLKSFIYDVSQIDDKKILLPETQLKELEFLQALGFKVNNYYKKCSNIDEVIDFWTIWQNKYEKEDYGIDGIAVKVNSVRDQKVLGYTGKAPRFCIAFKFLGKQVITIVEDINVQVGRTGVVTPVAVLKPVSLGGVTIKHATLHNQDMIKKLDIRIGDTVIVQRAGEVIPEVVGVLKRLRPENARIFIMPNKCPICKNELQHQQIGETNKQEMSVAVYCANQNCFAQRKQRFMRFVSKDCFDVVGLGSQIIERFMDMGLISKESDIFKLTYDDIALLDRFGDKSANNLLRNISNSKHIILEKFLTSLCIQHLGSESAKLLAKVLEKFKINKPSDIIKHISAEEINNISGFGPKVVASISAYFTDKDKIKLLEELDGCGVVMQPSESIISNKLANQNFVLTGVLDKLTREDAKSRIEKLGGHVSESVSKKTNFVVVGKNSGSKYQEALKLGIQTITEKDFLDMLS